MHNSYDDIRDRLGEPLWWDEYAVPRYCSFSPGERARTYHGDEIALLEIACQECGRRFNVAMSYAEFDPGSFEQDNPSLSEQIVKGWIHYGDPPNANCCVAGTTMNCEDLRVLEFWKRDKKDWTWVRCTEYEIELPDAKPYAQLD